MRHKIWQSGRTILPLGNGFAMRSFTLSRGANTARPIRQRKGDVLAIRWSDVENGFIRVKQSKTGAELFIPIHPTLAALAAELGGRGGVGSFSRQNEDRCGNNAFTTAKFGNFFIVVRMVTRPDRRKTAREDGRWGGRGRL